MKRKVLPWWGAVGFAVVVLGLVGLLTPSGDPGRGLNVSAVVAVVVGAVAGVAGLVAARARP